MRKRYVTWEHVSIILGLILILAISSLTFEYFYKIWFQDGKIKQKESDTNDLIKLGVISNWSTNL